MRSRKYGDREKTFINKMHGQSCCIKLTNVGFFLITGNFSFQDTERLVY